MYEFIWFLVGLATGSIGTFGLVWFRSMRKL